MGTRGESSPGVGLRTVHRFPSHPPWLDNCCSTLKAKSRAQLCTISTSPGHRQPEWSLHLPVHSTRDSQSTPRHPDILHMKAIPHPSRPAPWAAYLLEGHQQFEADEAHLVLLEESILGQVLVRETELHL